MGELVGIEVAEHRCERTQMGVYGYEEQPSFLDRMNDDQHKRHERAQINELKKESKEVPRREARRINKMVKNFETQTGLNQKRGLKKEEAVVKPTDPKITTHASWKIREKQKYDDQWGPLGW